MLPSVPLLTGILTGLVAKLGLNQLKKHGYMPQSTYVTEALKALEKDDLDEAVRNYRLSVSRWGNTKQSEIANEIIANAIFLRIAKLEARIQEIEEIIHPPFASLQFWRNLMPSNRPYLESLQTEQEGCSEAITVLKNIKGQLNFEITESLSQQIASLGGKITSAMGLSKNT